ncbi:MAG: exosortase U [Pirellulales bacterium]
MDTSRKNPPFWIWGILLVASLPLVVIYIWHTLDLPQYHFIPALVISFGLLFFGGWDRSVQLPQGRMTWSLLILGAITAIVGASLWSPWLGTIGFLLMLGAFLGSCNIQERWKLLRLWPLCWLILRLPLNFDFELTRWLQRVTARVSSIILDRFDIPHHLAGNVFHLPSGTLFVEEACSGIQSVFSLMFLAVLWVTWQHRSWLLLPIYVAFAVAWAGVMNILRVTIICYSQERWGLDLSHGLNHELLGYACLFVAIILLLSSDRLIRIVFYPAPVSRDGKLVNPVSRMWNWSMKPMSAIQKEIPEKQSSSPVSVEAQVQLVPRFAVPVSLIVSVIVLGSECVYGYRHWSATPDFVNTEYWKPNESLITQVPGVEVIGHETSTDSANPALGIHADLWSCRFDGMPTRILVSQHAELHDLCLCYGANGWNLRNRQHIEANQSNNQGAWDVVEASFVNSETIFGELFFSAMDRSGHPVRLSGWSLGSFLAGSCVEVLIPSKGV